MDVRVTQMINAMPNDYPRRGAIAKLVKSIQLVEEGFDVRYLKELAVKGVPMTNTAPA